MSRIFLCRKKEDDRDCCVYIDNTPNRFECGHYFSDVILHGPCYCMHDFPTYENVETVLTEDEYNALIQFSEDIDVLGYGITKDDERYMKGVELCNNIQYVYDKLKSPEGIEYRDKIRESEKEYMQE